jgi:hypothetical protein
VLPVVDDGIFGFRTVNVNAQRRDPNSFMNWTARVIRVRKECTELAWGDCEVLECDAPPVLVLSYRFRRASMVTLHNFSVPHRPCASGSRNPVGGASSTSSAKSTATRMAVARTKSR